MNHAPGPWDWFETEDGRCRVKPVNGNHIVAECAVLDPWSEEQRANACLIAAAPEMLQALERLLAVFNSNTDETVLAVNAAEGLIAKVRGDA